MKDYLEQMLHRPVELTEYTGNAVIPPVFAGSTGLFRLTFDGAECILIEIRDDMPLADLRRCHSQVERATGMRSALYLRKLNYYARDVLLREGIPFVLEDKLMYLPFLGMMLSAQEDRQIKACTQISFITQKLLLKSLYEGWDGITVGKAAEELQVSKMTVTRCFDEIEALQLPVLAVKSRARKLYADPDKKAMWEMIKPVMRNPVIRTYQLDKTLDAILPLSGISALSAYSMLEDNRYPTYAFTKAQMAELKTGAWREVPVNEQPACAAHEVGYLLSFGNKNAVDPLSVLLMLTEEEMADPRTEAAVNDMLEEYVW